MPCAGQSLPKRVFRAGGPWHPGVPRDEDYVDQGSTSRCSRSIEEADPATEAAGEFHIAHSPPALKTTIAVPVLRACHCVCSLTTLIS